MGTPAPLHQRAPVTAVDEDAVACFHRKLYGDDQALYAEGPLPPRDMPKERLAEIARRCQKIAIACGVDLERFEIVLTPTNHRTIIALAEKDA